jgi:hypothetical protein
MHCAITFMIVCSIYTLVHTCLLCFMSKEGVKCYRYVIIHFMIVFIVVWTPRNDIPILFVKGGGVVMCVIIIIFVLLYYYYIGSITLCISFVHISFSR